MYVFSQTNRNGLSRGYRLTASWLLLALAGCPSAESPRDERAGRMPPKDVKLSLAVVDDPALATAIEQLQGEWNAQTGSDYQVEQVSQGDLAAEGALRADAVICPCGLLGALAEKRLIAPVPKGLLEDRQGRSSDVFTLLRVREAVWGREGMGVPFGSPVLTVYYRAGLLEKLGRKPPDTWAEYQGLADLLSDRGNLGDASPGDEDPWHGVIEPLGPGWAGVVLLARAAPYASHRENYSTLFDINTMEPLVDGPPFVRALEELVAAAALGPPEQLTYDPAAVRTAFWQGQCGLALSWPTTAGKGPSPPDQHLQVGFAELPGSREAYDVAEKTWESRRNDEDPHVPLLAVAGRMGVVPSGSEWPGAAFQLLFWLSDEQSTQVSPSSPATTLFRSAHVERPGTWVERHVPARTAAQYAEMTQQTLCRPQCLFALRIPGRAEYLSALDEAVHQAVGAKQAPQEALGQAAARWREITDRLGVKRQRQAYWSSLGLE